MGFLKIMIFLHKQFAAETHPADGETLKVAVEREDFLELEGRTRMPFLSKKLGNILNLNKKKYKNITPILSPLLYRG